MSLHDMSVITRRQWRHHRLVQIALLVLAWLLDRVPHARRAAWLGWVFACVSLCGTVWWLFISLHTYGHLPAWLAGLGMAFSSLWVIGYSLRLSRALSDETRVREA